MLSRDAILAEIPRLRRYARALAESAEAADDLVQDTLERALGRWFFWQRERELRPWLFSIMHNLYVDGIRREGRIEYRDEDDLPTVSCRAPQTDALELRDLERALMSLPLEQREVLLLVGLEELSYAEVARALGVPQGTVMSRLSRARARLKSVLAGESGGFGEPREFGGLAPQLKVVKP